MRARSKLFLATLVFVMNSCCFGIKEEHLGNNIYLSEYDNEDRRIVYQTESCSRSVVEIVPMTILEMSYNKEWIIAKSGHKRREASLTYWIIRNHYEHLPGSETVIKNTTKFNNYGSFKSFMAEKQINL